MNENIIQGKRCIIRDAQNPTLRTLIVIDTNYSVGYNFASGESIEGEVLIEKYIDKNPNYFTQEESSKFTLLDYVHEKK